ncbi:hypothetical protein FVR03_23635 [Pontibacter qinzhouensis]|uniref:Alpha/beta hydrolase n=1 Tax=Pontibacter qinzhouensis TaxID=2603253 RepID=A0A5C8IJF2_9BACT|nr:hypothetical protein FVR03_23635 [Pontibacter qinzhouensis]
MTSFFLLFFCLHLPGSAQEWQWSVELDSVTAPETNRPPRAFLWIPPKCKRVQAVVVGQHHLLEEGILEHPAFRKEMADLGIAEIWVSPAADPVFDFEKGKAGEQFSSMMKALAKVSGYQELAYAPVVPIGHSAAASFPWNFGAWNPDRTLAMLSIKGDAPLSDKTGSGRPNPSWEDRSIEGVPGLLVLGESEWQKSRLAPALAYREKHPAAPISLLVDAGHGHFDYSDELVAYLALFIRKAAKLRLPSGAPLDEPFPLKPVDPVQGWLADQWQPDTTAQAPAAPHGSYTGKPEEAFWYFDKEMAAATERYYARTRGKKLQLLGFVQNEKVLQQSKKQEQVQLKFIPLEDGLTFTVGATFLDSVPAGNQTLAKGAKLSVGTPLGHAEGPVKVSRLTGPVQQVGQDTFRISFNRMGLDNPKRSNDIWFLASHPGDETYKSTVQLANLKIPLQHQEGANQKIQFPEIKNQRANKIKKSTLMLQASSTAEVPVEFYVREGPAVVIGNELRFTKIPPRSRFPIKVTVVAWQYGRNTEPKLKTAAPVEQVFYIVK